VDGYSLRVLPVLSAVKTKESNQIYLNLSRSLALSLCEPPRPTLYLLAPCHAGQWYYNTSGICRERSDT
jgi:hypothetical protein